MQILVESGANVNAQNKVGNTALALASFQGHVDVMTYLMQQGANAGLKDSKGHSAWDRAKDDSTRGTLEKLMDTYGEGGDAESQPEPEPQPEPAAPSPPAPDPLLLSQLAESQAREREYEERLQQMAREMAEREEELWRREQGV